jgi:hypothetical protein
LQQAPVLVEHYREHKMLDKEINFLNFIIRHYLNGNVKDADYTRDNQLPLKGTDVITSTPAGICMPVFFPELNFNPPVSVPGKLKVLDEDFGSTPFPSNIWQPPKFS